ncbi:hypothetical protein LOTGIDRAFT_157834 [Lottia gigantea]|uniref:Uncharacterized protein n=1 Tax=Lottia gigantea TaxID=225164 RepID=V4ATE8_LOTGI|nr:hypothetical protein LOTGIDRAFT_157834 [Lottia gigantea]ESP00558.1 hypothetical protein LOTGIDRAFT_157834 [Lottia gigantea]
MDVIDIDGLRKRAQRTKTKIQSEILFGKVRHSEVNHLTVTRIVGSHVECQKRVQTYRADLTLTLNNIKRQQCQLRRTMVHYSRKLRHNRKEREERERKAKLEAEMKSLKLPPIVEEVEQNADDRQSDSGSEFDTNFQENEENVDKGDVADKHDVEQTSETVIPTIAVEVEGESNEEINKDGKDTEPTVELQETNPMDILTKNLQESCNDPPKVPEVSTDPNDFNIEMYSKKKRKRQKQTVNYSDLIKLRHSTSKKKLFSLVDKLSKVHGHQKVERASQNQLQPGSKEHEPERKTSIFYPINYGYDVPDEPEPEVEPPKIPLYEDTCTSLEKVPDLPYNNLFSAADNKFWRELHQTRRANERSTPTNGNEIESKQETKTERRRRRASDLPLLVADYSDMKNRALKTDSEHHCKSRERVYHSAKSRYRQPRLLPPISSPMKF